MAQDDVSYKVVAGTVVGLFLAFGAVILRYIARRYQGMKTYWEDWFIYMGLICKLGIDIGGILLLQNGLGKHINTLDAATLVTFARVQYSGSFLYPACITFVKLSILMQYRRLFSHHSRSFHWQINVLITLVVLWGAGIILTAFFLCIPMEKNWHPQVEGTCIPIIPFYYGLQIPNIVTDLLIIVVPIREVMKLQLNKRLKTGAMTMFALGIITLVFDIIRLVALLEVSAGNKALDFTYNIVDVAVWTTIEPTVAILAVCIPSVRTLYRRNRHSQQPTNISTTLGNASSVRELKSTTQDSDMESAEPPSPNPQHASEEAHRHWPPVSMLLDSERPFQRFEEFDGRQRS